MRVYFSFTEEYPSFERELQGIALDPNILLESFGKDTVIYYYDWDTEEEFFSPMVAEDQDVCEVYDVFLGVIKRHDELDMYFNSWKEFIVACDKYGEETGEELDWDIEWTEEYKDGKLVNTTRPNIEELVDKLKSY